MSNGWDSNKYPATSKYNYGLNYNQIQNSEIPYFNLQLNKLYCSNITFIEIVASNPENNVKIIRIFNDVYLAEVDIKKIVYIQRSARILYIRTEDNIELILNFVNNNETNSAIIRIQKIIDTGSDYNCY